MTKHTCQCNGELHPQPVDLLEEQKYELAFAEGEAYSIRSLTVEWQEFKDHWGNTIKAIPLYEVERLAKRSTGKYHMLRRASNDN